MTPGVTRQARYERTAAAPVVALGVGGACSVLDIDGAPVFV
ncbi:hypothetical protein [Dactylosporangium matsuzakiense]|nr:hypothetical protein [Dactylosporangium matsuzakiense]